MTTALKKSELLTIDQFKHALPKDVKTRVSQPMVDSLNCLLQDQQLRENFRDNLLSYTNVMKDGRYRIGDYINAVRYVSHKLLGSTNQEAYAKTFPSRFQRLVDEGADNKTISSYSTAYNKTKLVAAITEQTLTPVHVINADVYQQAINKQVTLMQTAHSETVQQKAAEALMVHLKAPEVSKVELDVNVKGDKSIDMLQQTMRELAALQLKGLEEGTMNIREVAQSKLVQGVTIEQ